MTHAPPNTYTPTPGPSRPRDLPRYVDAELRRVGAFVTATAGAVYPGPVVLLEAVSYATQSPAGVGAAGVIGVAFGPAQGGAVDPVVVSAAGVVTFQQAGTWSIEARFRAVAGNNAVVSIRGLVDGAAAGGPWNIAVGVNGTTLLVTRAYTTTAGQTLVLQIGREGPVNDGSLEAGVSGLGWDDAPSAGIRILKY